MAEKLDSKLIPEVNIGVVGHVDHGKCIALDESILINNKLSSGSEIKSLAEQSGKIIHQNLDEKFYEVPDFYTYSFSSNWNFKRERSLIFTQPFKGDLLKILTKTGREISVTPEHPFLVNDFGKATWKKAKELKNTDQIAVISKLSIDPYIELNSNFIQNLSKKYRVFMYKDFLDLKKKTSAFKKFKHATLEDLNTIRTILGLSLISFSKEIGYSSPYLSEVFEVGRKRLSKNLKEKIIRFFKNQKISMKTNEIVLLDKKMKGIITKIRDPKEIDEDIAKWFAFVHAEGTSSENRIAVSQANYLNLVEDFLRISEEKFGVNFRKVTNDDWHLNNRGFVQYLKGKYSFKIGASRKSPICDWVIGLDEKSVAAFLRWFITFEAEVNNSGEIVIMQANKTNINILSLLLARFGIFSHLRKRIKYATNSKDKTRRTYYQLIISGKENLKKFLNKVSFEDEKKRKRIIMYLKKIKKRTALSKSSINIDYKILSFIRKAVKLGGDKLRKKSWFYAYRDCANTHRISIQKLRELILDVRGYRNPEVNEILDNLAMLCSENIIFDTTKEIKKVAYDGFVIDLSVPKSHNFIGGFGGIICHNSTLVQALTGKWPAVHSEELKRGITIRLGYADSTIYQCGKCEGYSINDKCLKCMEKCKTVRTVSFVDAPGHETLMATVLVGASLMDGALLIIAANEKCPQPQTREHLAAIDISGIKNIIIIQNKVDLVSEEKAMENYKQIKEFVKGTVAENSPIIPVSSQRKINVNVVLEMIQKLIPTPERKKGEPKAFIVRSFDVNNPGTPIKNIKGGVLGGALIEGSLKIGNEIEILPGISIGGKWKTLETKITGLHKAGKALKEAGPGGLLGIMTELDPSLAKADSIGGNVVVLKGRAPKIINSLKLEYHFLDTDGKKPEPLKIGDSLLINIGISRSLGVIKSLKGGVELELKMPMPEGIAERAAISKRIGNKWKLIGWGNVLK